LKTYRDEVISIFQLLQLAHNLQKQCSLFTQAVKVSAEVILYKRIP